MIEYTKWKAVLSAAKEKEIECGVLSLKDTDEYHLGLWPFGGIKSGLELPEDAFKKWTIPQLFAHLEELPDRGSVIKSLNGIRNFQPETSHTHQKAAILIDMLSEGEVPEKKVDTAHAVTNEELRQLVEAIGDLSEAVLVLEEEESDEEGKELLTKLNIIETGEMK